MQWVRWALFRPAEVLPSTSRALLVSACALLAASCGPKSLRVEETDIALTFEDVDRDYSKLETFYVPDQVVDLCEASMGGGSSSDVPCESGDHSLDDVLLQELTTHMQWLGYRLVDPDVETPDVAFYVGSVTQDNWYLVNSPGYCYGYSFWWYYGCWSPGYSYAYNLPTKTVFIEMAALDEKKQKASSAWTAILSGLYRDSTRKSAGQRVRDAVKRAFDQSPYLAEGKEP